MTAAIAAVITIPMLLAYLGLDGYGLWVTALALSAWVGLAHGGIRLSLLNRLAQVDNSDRPTRSKLVATAWWLGSLLALAVLGAVIVLDLIGAWPALFNVSSDYLASAARTIALAMLVGVAASIPLAIPVMILRADQQVHLAALVDLTAVLARAAAIVIVIELDLGLTWLAISVALAPVLIFAATATRIFGNRVQWPAWSLVDRSVTRALLSTSVAFAGIALAALVIASTDVLVITQLLGPAVVPTYSVAFAILLLFSGLGVAVLDALWPAYVEASAREDRRWVETAHRTVTSGLVAASVVFAATLILVGRPLICAWAGNDAVPPQALLVVFGGIAIVQTVALTHTRLLIGLGYVRRATSISLMAAAINVPTSIILGLAMGVVGVALGTLIAYVATGWLIIRDARRALRAVGKPRDNSDEFCIGESQGSAR